MKKLYHLVTEIAKMVLNAFMGALLFIKIDHNVASYPNADGSIGRVDYYYSIYDKLSGRNLQFLVFFALAVMAVSVALSVVSCVLKDNGKIRIASHVIFVVSALFFFVLLFYSMRVLQLHY